jgi:hypothetical protein
MTSLVTGYLINNRSWVSMLSVSCIQCSFAFAGGGCREPDFVRAACRRGLQNRGSRLKTGRHAIARPRHRRQIRRHPCCDSGMGEVSQSHGCGIAVLSRERSERQPPPAARWFSLILIRICGRCAGSAQLHSFVHLRMHRRVNKKNYGYQQVYDQYVVHGYSAYRVCR